jgi:predicted DNA-binding transcriptional regulator AlpA
MSIQSLDKPAAIPVPSKARVYDYTGLNESGLIRLQRSGQTLLVRGAVYARVSPTPEKAKTLLVKVNTTPGFERSPQDKSFLARSLTGEIFRIMGIVEKTVKPVQGVEIKRVHTFVQRPSQMLDVQNKPLTKHEAHSTAQLPPQSKDSHQPLGDVKKEAKLARLNREFQRVNAQRASSIDPAVRMAFAAHYLGESESNLYRKKAEGQFPQAIQRGKGAFWLMSDLDAFKAGTWRPAT